MVGWVGGKQGYSMSIRVGFCVCVKRARDDNDGGVTINWIESGKRFLGRSTFKIYVNLIFMS